MAEVSWLQIGGAEPVNAEVSWLQIGSANTPTITGPGGVAGAPSSVVSVVEGNAAVHTFSADVAVLWSIEGGADFSLFTIDPTSGALAFLAPLPSFVPPGGAAFVRKAANDLTAAHADGFVLSDYAVGETAEVYVGGVNTAVAGLTVGPAYLGLNGSVANTAPPAGTIRQVVGYVVSATRLVFQREPPIQT